MGGLFEAEPYCGPVPPNLCNIVQMNDWRGFKPLQKVAKCDEHKSVIAALAFTIPIILITGLKKILNAKPT